MTQVLVHLLVSPLMFVHLLVLGDTGTGTPTDVTADIGSHVGFTTDTGAPIDFSSDRHCIAQLVILPLPVMRLSISTHARTSLPKKSVSQT